ncbi:MAG: hypothetical protein ACR2QE_09390 [Acidimicrobiales bacterium]
MSRTDSTLERPLLLVGLPRSGTTWVARSLVAGGSVDLVLEPDNEGFHPLAYGYKRAHRFPAASDYADSGLPTVFDRATRGWTADPRTRPLMKVIGRHRWELEDWIGTRCGGPASSHAPAGCPQRDPDTDQPLLARACRGVMPVLGRRRRRRLIKSVHAVRTVEPIVDQIDADVLLVVRNPFAVVASLQRVIPVHNWSEPQPNADRYRGLPPGEPAADPVQRTARGVTHLLGHIRTLAETHPSWTVVAHDHLCRGPADALPGLAEGLGLHDTERVRQAALDSDRPGTGYETKRVSSDQIDGWKKELTSEQVSIIESEVDASGLWPFLHAIGATGDR